MFPQIRCNWHVKTDQYVFYILSKGLNAGKPSLTPWRNSFAIICPNKMYFGFYFWLIHALSVSGKFKLKLRGSAIPFININDVRDLIREVGPAVFQDWARFNEIITALDKLQHLKTSLQQQVNSSEQLQKALINQYFKETRRQ